jgi:hypothetical protein
VRKNTAQYNTIQQSLTRSASEMASGVELPVPHIAFPVFLKAILLEIDGIACHAAFHPKPRTKAEMFENTVAKSHHTSHIDQYSKTCEKVLLRLIDYLVLSAMLQIPPSSERSPPFRTGIPSASRSPPSGSTRTESAPCEHGNGYHCNLKSLTLNARVVICSLIDSKPKQMLPLALLSGPAISL